MLNTPCIEQVHLCSIFDFLYFSRLLLFLRASKKTFTGTQLDVLSHCVCVSFNFLAKNDSIFHLCLDYYNTNDKESFNLYYFFDKQIKRMQSPICFHFIFFMVTKNIQKVNKQCTIRKAPLTICVVVIGIKCTIHIQIQVKFE